MRKLLDHRFIEFLIKSEYLRWKDTRDNERKRGQCDVRHKKYTTTILKAVTERGRDHAPESMCEQMSWSNIPKTVMSLDMRKTRDGGSLSLKKKNLDKDDVKSDDGGNEETSSTVLRSCRAGRSTAARLLQRAWCRTRHSSGCTPRWGRNECRKSNSSTSHRDSGGRVGKNKEGGVTKEIQKMLKNK